MIQNLVNDASNWEGLTAMYAFHDCAGTQLRFRHSTYARRPLVVHVLANKKKESGSNGAKFIWTNKLTFV